jgi:hypothetical protein
MSTLGHLEIKTNSRRRIVFKEKQIIYVFFFHQAMHKHCGKKTFMKGLENVIIPTSI